jgi:REP element-mobilizing transposase RayT
MKREVQTMLGFPQWGGKRKGAGRKRKAPRPRVEHRPRPKITKHVPVHVTLRLLEGLPTLRRPETHAVLVDALAAGTERLGMRVVHYSAMSNHLHLLCEASDAASLSKGMQGLCIRVARALNRHWNRSGPVFDDRYHSRPLRSPAEVHRALGYLMRNATHHGILPEGVVDPFSTAGCFDGWEGGRFKRRATPLSEPESWLLESGWRQHGLFTLDPHLESAGAAVATSPTIGPPNATRRPGRTPSHPVQSRMLALE